MLTKLNALDEFSHFCFQLYILHIYKKLKEQLDKHIKLKDKKKTALHEFSSSYETSSGKIKLQMLLLLYDKELTRDYTKLLIYTKEIPTKIHIYIYIYINFAI